MLDEAARARSRRCGRRSPPRRGPGGIPRRCARDAPWPRRRRPARTRDCPGAHASGQITGDGPADRLEQTFGGVADVHLCVTRSSRAAEGQARRRRGNQRRLNERVNARCQCLNDEQPRADPPLEALESASREAGRPTPTEDRREEHRRVVRPGTSVPGVRPRLRGRTRLHLRVVLRPARGRLRLRRHRRGDQPREDRRRAASDLALRRPAAGRATARPSTSAPGSRRWSAPTASPPSSGSARCGSRTTRCNPTNSFKDRVASVALSKALEFGFKTAACASTGNLANSVAAHAAHAGLRSFVFIPADLEQGKVVTTAVYGGNVVAIDGNYDDVNRLCAELAGMYRWAFVNVNVRPYYAEGSKTLAFETAEQLGWEAPDHVVVPVASGSLLTKIRKGFDELHKVGLLDARAARAGLGRAGRRAARRWRPRALDGSRHHPPGEADTIAKSLAIGNPADGYFALDAVRQTGGGLAAVTDDEIVEGIRLLARTEGIFAETAGGVTDRDAEAARRGGRRPARRARRRLHHRPRAEDARRGRAARRADRDDRPDARRVPRGVRPATDRGVGARRMAVTVRIPRSCASSRAARPRSTVEGGDRRRGAEGARGRAPRLRRAPLRRERRAAPLRQRVRRRRGHPLPRRPRHARRRRPDRQHRPRVAGGLNAAGECQAGVADVHLLGDRRAGTVVLAGRGLHLRRRRRRRCSTTRRAAAGDQAGARRRGCRPSSLELELLADACDGDPPRLGVAASRTVGADVRLALRARDRVAVRARHRVAEQLDELLLDVGRDRVLPPVGLAVHLLPLEPDHVGEQPLGEPVPAHDGRREAAALRR